MELPVFTSIEKIVGDDGKERHYFIQKKQVSENELKRKLNQLQAQKLQVENEILKLEDILKEMESK